MERSDWETDFACQIRHCVLRPSVADVLGRWHALALNNQFRALDGARGGMKYAIFSGHFQMRGRPTIARLQSGVGIFKPDAQRRPLRVGS